MLRLVIELELAVLPAEVVRRALVPDHPVCVVRVHGLPADRIDRHGADEDANEYEGIAKGLRRAAFGGRPNQCDDSEHNQADREENRRRMEDGDAFAAIRAQKGRQRE